MSGDVSMLMVVEALRETYFDDGIAIYLAVEHVGGPFEGRRPIDVCKTIEGRFEVWSYAQRLAGGDFA